MKIETIPLDQATDVELQYAAKWAGLDEVSSRVANLITADKINKTARQTLLNLLEQAQYTKIQVDMTQRLLVDPGLISPEVGVPI
jgi:hypothetical protein